MRNDFTPLPRALLLFALGALLLVSACSRTGTLTIILDSNLAAEGLEVLLVPVDPAPLLRENAPRATAGQADSLLTLSALEDSATAHEQRFLRLRDDLNTEASALSRVNRRSDEYAERYDEFRPRAAHADSLRTTRDKLRGKASAYRTALAAILPDSARIRELAHESRRTLNGARDRGRRSRGLSASAAPLLVQLEPGRWWIGIAQDGLVPMAFQEISIRLNVFDTLRLRVKSH